MHTYLSLDHVVSVLSQVGHELARINHTLILPTLHLNVNGNKCTSATHPSTAGEQYNIFVFKI